MSEKIDTVFRSQEPKNPDPRLKICPRCKESKSVDFYYKSDRWPCGFYPYCKPCKKKITQDRAAKTRVKKHPVSVTEKTCGTCKESKPSKNFHKDSNHVTGLAFNCKMCVAGYQGTWKQRNKEYLKQDRKKRYASLTEDQKRTIIEDRRCQKYNITKPQLYKMLGLNNGVCFLCNAEPGTDIDHCHTTGVVRGMLCALCNMALAAMEKPGVLERAAGYLKRELQTQADLKRVLREGS